MASKTNAMRMLDSRKIRYEVHEYPQDGPVAAEEVAAFLGEEADRVFKTLVTTDGKRNYYVFCLPGDHELDLKKAARTAGVKKIEMIKQKELLKLTGYIHGGCSPVGMKKVFPTFIDSSAQDWETIYVSGGKIGLQVELAPEDIGKVIDISFENITK